MNVFSEINIRSKNGTDYLIEKIKEFGKHSGAWIYDEERSNRYSENLAESKGCVLIYCKNEFIPGFAFCEKKEGCIYIANIVPKETGQISIPEYNALSRKFYDEFRKWNRKEKNGIQINISKTELDLEDIITAKIPRKSFQRFLNMHPLSHHPYDIGRLDRFICSIARYSRKPINWNYLGEFLREKKNWSETNISWCLNRIETGLEIISVYKRY